MINFVTWQSEFDTFDIIWDRDKSIRCVGLRVGEYMSFQNHETPTLNDAFDVQLRRIIISDGAYRDGVYFYNPEEQKPVHFYDPDENSPVHFFDGSELFSLDTDFVVLIPFQLTEAQEIRMRSLIDFYRLPDKTYNLQIN